MEWDGERRRVDRLKRAMLRGAIADNLATIEGRSPLPRRRGLKRSWIWWTPVTLLALLVLVETLGSTTPAGTVVTERAPAAAAPSSAAVPAVSLAAPRVVPPNTFHLAVRRVVVDPGHGGTDPGATARGLREKDFTVDIARRVRGALENEGFEVVLTRDADETISLLDRVQAANKARGDLFLSIHVNSIPTPERRGVETYFLGTTTDPRVEELSGAENVGSGYSLADFRALLEGVLLDVRLDESRRFGRSVQARLHGELQRWNPSLEDRGVKQAPFVVLVGTEMPAVLAEVACLSNREDAELLRDASYRQSIAAALAAGVRDFASSFSATPRAGNVRPGQ